MMSSGEEDINVSETAFISFNQDTTCVAVGTVGGYRLHSINSTDSMDLVHRDEEPEVYIAERLFSSSLVAVVSTTNPRTLRVCHFKKGTEICRYSYNDKIRAVRMNRSRLVVCLEESLYIHNIRDMKVIHIITSTPPNPNGLIALSADTSNFCFLAYPGHSHTGQLQVFDAETLACRVVIPAHEGQLAALQFSRTNTRIATASLKGTVIRVFDTRDGSKLYELRRGLKRTASIFSLSFSPCGTFLACSSNTETVHVFKLDERSDPGEAGTYGSPPNDEGWYGYINSVVSASAGYLPSQVTDTFTQGRAFATVHLTRTGARTICSLAVIRKSLRLVVCDATGWVGLYSLDQEEGGDCSLIRQFLLIDSDTGDIEDIENETGTDSGNASDSGNVSETGSRTSPAPDQTYSDKLRNRKGNEMTDSEKFHEMEKAAETPPKTCFLLDDDGEFPPVAFAAS